MTEIRCTKCGAVLEKSGEEYVCPGCGARYEERRAEDGAAALAKLLDVQKQEAVANLRQQLWREFNEEYIDREKLSSAARKIRTYLPDDFFATFCELACGRDQKKLNAFLNQIDVAAHGGYIADVVRFMLKIVRRANLLALNDLLERGRAALGQDFYNKYYPVLARESEKLDEEVYNPSLPRDAFILYSSADMAEVSELVDALEGEGLKCFVAARNIRHGFASDYENILYRAIDSSKVAVFVSTSHSRSTECDALKVEMEYIRKQDAAGAPAEARADYAKLARKYKKPRVEYVAEAYSGKEIERVMKELFAGFERCNSVRDVVRQVIELERGAGKRAEHGARKKKSLFFAAKEPVTAVDGAENAGEDIRRAVDAGRGIAAEREGGEEPSADADWRTYCEAGEYDRAIPLLRAAAKKGDAEARFRLGECYENGRGVYADLKRAARLYRRAAKQGFASAQLALGNCFSLGRGARRSRKKAATWYLKAAEQGLAEAQYRIGLYYYEGDSPWEARVWYLRAADQGHVGANCSLGCYYEGFRDFDEARKWYRKAAAQGDKDAQRAIDRMDKQKKF